MSIESRLTALQSKVEEILTVAKSGNGRNSNSRKDEDPWSLQWNSSVQQQQHEEDGQELSSTGAALLSPQAEIRTLELWRSVVAECLGTLCFVFFVCGVSIPWTGHYPPFLSIAFATSLTYGALTYRIFPRAHLNPAFTLAFTAIKRVTPLRCILFLTAQSGGAIAGSAILYGLTAPGYQGSLGATAIAQHISSVQAFGLEMILTFVMTLTFVSDPRNSFATSCVLLAATLVALPCTGAGLNPARSLGPAFVMNKWPNHWVFWLGPLAGGLVAVYLHTYVLRRGPKTKKVRESPSDGDSLDIPPSGLANTLPDRMLCERFEPIYGGTRSLYMKPSPVLPRQNLHRSQSVYASKRYDFPPVPKFHDSSAPSSVVNKTKANVNTEKTNCQRHLEPDTNYEPLYDRKPVGGTGQSLLVSGPPSYESNYFKSYDTAKSNHSTSSHGHGGHSHQSRHHHHHGSNHPHHQREKSDSMSQRAREKENHTNRILAQYGTTKGLLDVESKGMTKAEMITGMYYESNERNQKIHEDHQVEKKLADAGDSSEKDKPGNPMPPPRFKVTQSEQPRQSPNVHNNCATPPLPHSYGPVINDLNRCSSFGKGSVCGPHSESKKNYELIDAKELLEFNNGLCGHQSQQQRNSNNYSPRLLMAERDSTYSRILEPLLNSKHLLQKQNHHAQSQHNKSQHAQQQALLSPQNPHLLLHGNPNGTPFYPSPSDVTYSYH